MSKKEFVVRFGVYDDKTQKRSSTWRVWVPFSKITPKSDVYITSRALGKYQKVSLHESGDWRLAFLNQKIALSVPTIGKPRTTRIVQRWVKPESIGARVILAYRVIIPISELRQFGTKEKKVNWIPSPDKDDITELDIMFTEPGAKVSGWPAKNKMKTKLIGKYLLPNKSTLWIVYRYEKASERLRSNIKMYKRKVQKLAENYIKKEQTKNDASIRFVVYGYEQDGSRTSIELAYK